MSKRNENVVPIGRPIANVQIYILDAHRQLVPRGVVGEIYIAGSGVARGYFNRADLTEERFMPDPFSPQVGARMYRTGDLARILPDGNLEFKGRVDQQVKIRGYRVEPGEIEASLTTHPAICEAIVLARENATDYKKLIAYVVIAPEFNYGSNDLVTTFREFLANRLPEYMIPSVYVRLDEIPMTSSGKVNRGALHTPTESMLIERPFSSPEGEVEEGLASIWAELLGVNQIGREDDFFQLGGHSLLAVRLLSCIRAKFGVSVALSALIIHSRLSIMASEISSMLEDGAVSTPRI